MSSQGRPRDAVVIHPPESLCHPNDCSVLRLELLEVPLSPLNDENCLREIRGVDDRKLSAGWCSHENEDECSNEYASHHWGLLPLEIEAPSRARYAGSCRSLV